MPGAESAERRGKPESFPLNGSSVVGAAHETEGHQPPAKEHRQRPEDQRRRGAAAFRQRGCSSCCSGRRVLRPRAGSVAVGLDQFDREGFPFPSTIPVSDNLTTPSTFRADVLPVICSQSNTAIASESPIDQLKRKSFPFLSPIPVSDNLTTPSTFRTDVLPVICPQMDVWHRSPLSWLASTLIASTYADDVIASTISLVISRIRCAFSASQPRLFLLLCPSLS